MYKASKSRYSTFHGHPVVDIWKKKKFLWFSYWAYDHMVFDFGQSEEVVYLLNNPEVLKERISKALKKD